jgi:hypothetical protein
MGGVAGIMMVRDRKINYAVIYTGSRHELQHPPPDPMMAMLELSLSELDMYQEHDCGRQQFECIIHFIAADSAR